MFQLRTYTLSSDAALETYATVHWPRHIPSLAAIGVTTHGIWTEPDGDVPRLFALVSYPEGVDPRAVDRQYMSSAAFREDMAGFDPAGIVHVEETLLAATVASPLQ